MCENSCLENHYCIDLRRQELAKVGVEGGSYMRRYVLEGVLVWDGMNGVLWWYDCDKCGIVVWVGGGGLLGTGVNVVLA